MSRIKSVTDEEAKGQVKEIYSDLKKKMGKVINIFSNMGNSPETLAAFLHLNESAGKTSLSPQLREKIALIVAQTNHCQYCLSAHSMLAKGAGINDEDIMKARHANTDDAKEQAILKFAKNVVENRGQVNNQEIANLKAFGVSDKELVEIMLVIMVNIFTNYFNNVTDPQVDFPAAPQLV